MPIILEINLDFDGRSPSTKVHYKTPRLNYIKARTKNYLNELVNCFT
jgi:hypothetical protein